MSHRFDGLRERLLRGGVAPRHVRRYLRELRDHHADVVRDELANGTRLEAAQELAWKRLGTEESLAASALARPELRSMGARFPALVFGVAPLLGWFAVPFVLVLGLSLLSEASRHIEPTAGFISSFQALCFIHTRLLPVLLGVVVLELGARQRLPIHWPLLGAALVDTVAGSFTVQAAPGQLQVSSALLPWLLPFSEAFGPRQLGALGEGLLTATGLLALGVLVQRLARRLLVRTALAAG